MIQLDKHLFLFLNTLGSESWDGFWLFMTDKFNMIPLYLVLLIYTFRHIGWKKGLWFVFTIAILITCTDQITNLFKDGFARLRPCHDPDISPLMRLVKDVVVGCMDFLWPFLKLFALAIFFITFLNLYILPCVGWFCGQLLLHTVEYMLAYITPLISYVALFLGQRLVWCLREHHAAIYSLRIRMFLF